MPPEANRNVVAVIGSGSQGYPELSKPIGIWLAESGFDIVTGGGSGVMAAVAEAHQLVPGREGKVIGILPSSQPCESPEERNRYHAPLGYPNPHVDYAIRTHLPLSGPQGKTLGSRNHIVVLTGDCVLAFPGQEGTRSEIQLALEYGKPTIVLSPERDWNEFLNSQVFLVKTVKEAQIKIEEVFR